MAFLNHSLFKCIINSRTSSYGKYVRLRRHYRNLRSVQQIVPEKLPVQWRRHIMTTTTWKTRQTDDLFDSDIKQKIKKKDQESVQKMADTDGSADHNVPLIVRLLNRNKERTVGTEERNNKDQNLTLQKLQRTLEDIKWDADATRHRSTVEELKEVEEVQPDEPESEGDLADMKFVEDIYLDDEVPQARALQQQKQTKYKIKGTPDPSIPASDVPCSGCGATLHCQDPIIPGYMASEKFKCLTREEMRTSVCQRCFLIKMYNMFLNVRVSAETYPQILKEIERTKALVVVVVDLFDMKNSVFKNLLTHIGTNRPLFIVGNKVDLIPKDSGAYLERTKQMLVDMCNSAGLNPTGKNIKHVCLVSAKTGYGIESLVTKLMKEWQLKGHVYVVGSTNVGKSTLFNALLMSDYCKAVARGFINRATVSVWPGTTLNLLKFPIVNPSPWRLAARNKRLVEDQKEYAAAEELRRARLEEFGSYKADLLTGHIGLTDFRSPWKIEQEQEQAEAEQENSIQHLISFKYSKGGYIDESSDAATTNSDVKGPGYKPEGFKMYWCNDTPGVVNPEQIINLLEPEELSTILPRTKVMPQCIVLHPGQVMFVTGLGRIDYVQGKTSVYLTVYAAHAFKLHVLKSGTEADEFYCDNLGTPTLGVPVGDEERLSKVPALVGREFQVTGTHWKAAAADIQLSSLGWVSVAAGSGMPVVLRAYTPGGRGLYLRTPSLLPHYTFFKGKRKGKTPFYRPAKRTL